MKKYSDFVIHYYHLTFSRWVLSVIPIKSLKRGKIVTSSVSLEEVSAQLELGKGSVLYTLRILPW